MEHTKSLTDEITIQESPKRAGNNIKTGISDSITVSVSLDSVYKIKRVGDTSFLRTNYP